MGCVRSKGLPTGAPRPDGSPTEASVGGTGDIEPPALSPSGDRQVGWVPAGGVCPPGPGGPHDQEAVPCVRGSSSRGAQVVRVFCGGKALARRSRAPRVSGARRRASAAAGPAARRGGASPLGSRAHPGGSARRCSGRPAPGGVLPPSAQTEAIIPNSRVQLPWSPPRRTGNDPSAGSPTETLLRLLLPLDSQV